MEESNTLTKTDTNANNLLFYQRVKEGDKVYSNNMYNHIEQWTIVRINSLGYITALSEKGNEARFDQKGVAKFGLYYTYLHLFDEQSLLVYKKQKTIDKIGSEIDAIRELIKKKSMGYVISVDELERILKKMTATRRFIDNVPVRRKEDKQ